MMISYEDFVNKKKKLEKQLYDVDTNYKLDLIHTYEDALLKHLTYKDKEDIVFSNISGIGATYTDFSTNYFLLNDNIGCRLRFIFRDDSFFVHVNIISKYEYEKKYRLDLNSKFQFTSDNKEDIEKDINILVEYLKNKHESYLKKSEDIKIKKLIKKYNL